MADQKVLQVVKPTSEPAAYKNVVQVSTKTFDELQSWAAQLPLVLGRPSRYVIIEGTDPSLTVRSMVYTYTADRSLADLSLAMFYEQRHCTLNALGGKVALTPWTEESFLESVRLGVRPKSKLKEIVTLDSAALKKKALDVLRNQFLAVGQEILLMIQDANYVLTVEEIKAGPSPPTPRMRDRDRSSISSDVASSAETEAFCAILVEATNISFVSSVAELRLSGKFRMGAAVDVELQASYDFKAMGFGGMDEELEKIFRAAFLSRQVPPDIIESFGTKHAKGMLLYGPPGVGKTLIARQLAKMMRSREPKIVNGPDVFNSLVGKTEENIRKLFEDAEKEYAARGNDSALHMIVFDEIDAVCRARGTTSGDTGVHDAAVNQLLTKIDGVHSLNNVFVIGMTNRPDMLDPALTRAGRLELQVEIPLPSEHGRRDIFEIHTKTMRESGALGENVLLEELAALTKNFTGSEIAQLVKTASDFSLHRLKRECDKKKISMADAPRPVKVIRDDFMAALEEVKPQHGRKDDAAMSDCVRNGIVNTGRAFTSFMNLARMHLASVASQDSTQELLTMLLQGEPQSGKTALAATLATEVDFPFVRLIAPTTLVRRTDLGKSDYINEVFNDSYKSKFSVIVIDDIELILDYVPVGQRFSAVVYSTLMTRLRQPPPPGCKLLVICTTSQASVLDTIGLGRCFDWTLNIPLITIGSELQSVLEEIKAGTQAPLLAPADVSVVVRAFDESTRRRKHGIPIKKVYKSVDFAKQTAARGPVASTLCDLLDCTTFSGHGDELVSKDTSVL